MKFHCIADEDTVRGFRLAGIPGTVVNSTDQTAAALAGVLAQPDCGIVVLTRQIADDVRPLVEQIRFEREQPLLVEIPGPAGTPPGRKSLRQLVQEAVGLHLDSEKGN